ncbi:deleted in malignant brain tumors 1 protein-like [Acanthaster planci]|uniref:Deleted in malignant brain tumors 1 protein-like n=1 Tax=Acanthaster planci TaxID=133434 RepID=A0A8B7YVS9_ACAPL|nr:deleted in malignant brain tumors 1 protein-like [Acanthaster planci]
MLTNRPLVCRPRRLDLWYSSLYGNKISYKRSMYCLAILLQLVVAAFTQEHDLRLSNIGGKQGRVEVLNNGQWGTICKDGWNFFDALVVCKQLGFPWLARNGWKHDAGNGTGPVWLSNVECKGPESRLEECPHDGWMQHQCADTSHAAAVTCLDQEEFRDLDIIKEVMYVFLRDGNAAYQEEGLILLNLYTDDYERRFLLCDQGWNLADANVICRQKGFDSVHRATTGFYFGRHDPKTPYSSEKVSYLATNFSCIGNESHILQCPAQAWFQDDCPNGYQAGVVCNRVKEPEDFQIRLVNGTNPNEGRLEVYLNGSWGSVCVRRLNYEFAYQATNVICQQLGLGYGLDAPSDGRFGRGSGPVVMSGLIDCSGGESSFAQCFVGDEKPNQRCLSWDSTFEANVICSGPIPESRNPIRLLSYSDMEVGILLIYHDGRWGAVCGEDWSDANSQVACRELGFGPPKSANKYLGRGPMFLGGVSCTGDEVTLDQCSRGQWYQHGCTQDNAILLVCSAGASYLLSSTGLLLASLVTIFCLE